MTALLFYLCCLYSVCAHWYYMLFVFRFQAAQDNVPLALSNGKKKRENLTTGIRLIRWTKLATTQAYAMEKCNKKSLSSVLSTPCYVFPQAYVYLQIYRKSLTILFPFLFDSMALIFVWCLFSTTNQQIFGRSFLDMNHLYICMCVYYKHIHTLIYINWAHCSPKYLCELPLLTNPEIVQSS